MDFVAKEAEMASKFPNKGSSKVGSSKTRFNGVDISRFEDGFVLDQVQYMSDFIDQVPSKSLTFDEFRSLRAKYAYAAYSSAPDILVYVAVLAQYTHTRFEQSKDEALQLLRKMRKVALALPSQTG